MIQIYKCLGVARTVYHPTVLIKEKNPLKTNFVQTRTFFNVGNKVKSRKIFEERIDETEMPPLTGIDDPNFTKSFMKVLRNPDPKAGFNNFSTEVKKFKNEWKMKFDAFNPRIDSRDGRIDMVFTFETPEDLKKFSVHTDSSFSQGYSSAALGLTQQGTALFSGNICTDVPKDGNVVTAGYANFSSIMECKSFYRRNFLDWADYTHLVLKVRGDGRTYIVLIKIYGEYEETKYFSYSHPLYTRGGPYWQIAKIPFSHFYLTERGCVMKFQNHKKMLRQIERFGLTVAGLDGPFKLEIDYIGLEHKKSHDGLSPYESYKKP